MATGHLRRAALALVAAAGAALTCTLMLAPVASAADDPAAVAIDSVGATQVGGFLHVHVLVTDTVLLCTYPPYSCLSPTGVVAFTLSGPGGSEDLGTRLLRPKTTRSSEVTAQLYPSLPAGTYTLTAHYLGDKHFGPHHATRSITLSRADVTVNLQSSKNPINHGQPLTLTARVWLIANEGTPSIGGSVQFTDNGKPMGAPVGLSAIDHDTSTAVLTTSALSVGSHTIAAGYSGDANYNAGSDSVPERVTMVLHLPPNVPCPDATCMPSGGAAGPASGSATPSGQGHAAGDSGIGTQGPSAAGPASASGTGQGVADPAATAADGAAASAGTGADGAGAGGAGTNDVGTSAGSASAGGPDPDVPATGTGAAALAATTTPAAHGSSSNLWLILVIVLVVLAVIAALLWWLLARRRPRPAG